MNNQTLFKTIPTNASPLWNEEFQDFNYKQIANIFFDKKKEKRIEQLTGISKHFIRYDDKMPQDLKDFLQFMASIFHLVYGHFNDFDKTKIWFELPNPMLGEEITPKHMIWIGRHKKLFEIISSALKEELP